MRLLLPFLILSDDSPPSIGRRLDRFLYQKEDIPSFGVWFFCGKFGAFEGFCLPMVLEARQGASSSSSSAAASLMLTSGASWRVTALFSARAMKSFVAHLCAFLLMLLIPFRFRKRSAVSSAVVAGEKGREERSSEGSEGAIIDPSIKGGGVGGFGSGGGGQEGSG